jgi:hypothetical protein
MNSEFKNEILMDGFLVSKDLENKKFQIKNNDDIIEFRYDENFKESNLEELQENELIRIKGSFDQDDEGIFYLAKDMLVLPQFSKGDI